MDVHVSRRVKNFLDSRGIAADELPESLLNRLNDADESIQRRIDAASKAAEAIKESRVTVAAVARDMKAARKTVYNNRLLLEFIENGKAAQQSLCPSSPEVGKLREKNEALSNQLRKMMSRDAESEELKAEIVGLAKALESKDATIADLEESNRRLRRILADARSKIPPMSGNVIEFGSAKAREREA